MDDDDQEVITFDYCITNLLICGVTRGRKGIFWDDLYFVMCSQLYLNIHLFIFKIFDKKASCNKGPLSAISVPEILKV